VQNFENRLRFDKVTESLKVGTFLKHGVQTINHTNNKPKLLLNTNVKMCHLPLIKYNINIVIISSFLSVT